MANTFKNATLELTTVSQDLYTCPAGTQSVVHSLFFANIDGVNTITIDVEVYDSSKTTAYSIGNDLTIPPNSTLYFDKPINLEVGDKLRVSASGNNDATAVASILEIA